MTTRARKRKKEVEKQNPVIRLDFGCGMRKTAGFTGVDVRDFVGVDWLCDVRHVDHRGRFVFWAKEPPANAIIESPGQVFRGSHLVIPRGYRAFTLPDNSVTEAVASHFIEHLTGPERMKFVNELHRLLKPRPATAVGDDRTGQCLIIVPHCFSARAYGDLTHQWPPVSEFWFYYLDKAWRATQAPHNEGPDGYKADLDFGVTWGYNLRGDLVGRNQEYINNAVAKEKEAAQDIVATLTKRVPEGGK